MEPDQLRRLHEGGLRVLEETGVVFKDDETLATFGAHGFRVDGARVHMTGPQVHAALASAPRSFQLEARHPDRSLVFGDGETVISNVAGAALIIEGGELRAGTMEDQEKCVRLCHMLPNLDLLGHTLSPANVSDSGRYEQTLYNYFTLSNKQFEHPISDARHLRAGLDMTEIVFGAGWHERPTMFVVINPMSPLLFDVHTCVTACELARRNQPLCVTSCAMGGTTGPTTLAGLLVQQHAETLAGIVLIQLVQPGCPAMYGGFSSDYFDAYRRAPIRRATVLDPDGGHRRASP
jgi:trimethylamine--corrinoid protein Co-methyltransferase